MVAKSWWDDLNVWVIAELFKHDVIACQNSQQSKKRIFPLNSLVQVL